MTFTDSDRFLVFAFSVSQLLSTLNIRQSAALTIVLLPETCKGKHRCSPLVASITVRLLDTPNGWTCWFTISDNLLRDVVSYFARMVTAEDFMSWADVNRQTRFKLPET